LQLGKRLESLDAFRGLTIAAMILVNNPGTWAHVYSPLRHAEWNGWTLTDLVFPFFLFIVGVAMTFSLPKYMVGGGPYRKIARRAAVIFLLGLLLAAFPRFDLAHLRIPGVLQRIALVYLAAALITANTKVRGQMLWASGLLVGYQILMTWVPVPGYGAGNLAPDGNLAAYLDRALLGGHLWRQVWDPEGILSTLPAISTALLGVLTGHWLRSGRDRREIGGWLFVNGWALILAGQIWNLWFPINKSLWTSSYVLFTAGAALQLFGICYWLIEVAGIRRWATPALQFGRNPLFLFVLSGVLVKILLRIRIGAGEDARSLYSWIYRSLFTGWLSPLNASLAFALAMLALLWAIAWALDRRRIYIKV